MALAITVRNRGIVGDLRYVVAAVAFDAFYASGGEPLTAANLGLDFIDLLQADAPAGYVLSYDYTGAVLRAYRIDVVAGAGVSGADNTLIKSATSTLEVAGTGTAFQVALGEVTATNDMSTDLAAVRIFVVGR